MFEYKAKVVRVVDGDTIDVIIDLGFSVNLKRRVRLVGINAPESRTSNKEEKVLGLASKAALNDLLMNHPQVILQTTKAKKGKFGRFLAKVFVTANGIKALNVNDWLVDGGFAVYKEY